MSDNENNKDEEGNEKPKRPLSAYNFFLKEERKNILQNMITDNSTTQSSSKSDTSNGGAEQSNGSASNNKSRRPMKKRRLMEPPKKSGLDGSNDDNENGGISFERIGKLIGERWQEVKAKPELFVKYEKLASSDHKRYMGEMKSYNDRKKNVLRSVMNSAKSTSIMSDQCSTTKSDLKLSSVGDENNHRRSSSTTSAEKFSRLIPSRNSPEDQQSTERDAENAVRGSLTNVASHDAYRLELEQHQNNTTASGASPATLINLQSLLAANRSQQHAAALPLEYFTGATAANQIPLTANSGVLGQLTGAQALPFMRNAVGLPQSMPDNNAINLALLRQQEELALLRQEALYRDFMQMEQARAYLAASTGSTQGLQGLGPQQAQLGAVYAAAPSIEALLAQQSAGLQLAALQQNPQQAQLVSLLQSQLQYPSAQR